MTVTAENIRLWLGPSAAVLTDGEIGEMIGMSTDVVDQMVQSLGGSGTPDTPVKYVTAAHVYRALDARNVKPASISEGGVTVSTDIGTAWDQFMTAAENAVMDHVLAADDTEETENKINRFVNYRRKERCGCRPQ